MSQSSPEPFSVKQHHHPQISATAIERPVSATSIHYYRRYLDPFQYSVRSGTGVAHSQPLAQTAYQNNTELTSAGEEVKNQHPSNGSLLATNLPSTPPIGCSPIQREHHQNFTQSKAGINAFSDNKQIFLPPLSGNNTNSMPRGEIPGPGYPTPAHSFERSIQLPPLSSVIRPYVVGKGHSSPMPPSSSTAPTLTTHGLHAVSHSADTAHRATLLHETVLPESRAAYPWSAEEHRKSAAALPKTTLTNAGPNLPSGYTASAPFGLGIYNAVGPQRAFETKSTFMGQDMMYHRRFKSDSHSVTILSAPDGVKRRTKTGCITCRKRRIKCDEHHPTCQNCDKSMRVCLAYDPIFLGTMERDLSSDDPSPKFKILHKSFSSFAGEGQLQRLLEYQARPEGRNQPKKMKITTLLNSTCEMDSENAIASGTVAAGNIYSCSKRSISMPSPTTWDELLNFYLEFVAQHLDEIFLTSRFSQAVAGAVTGMLSGGQGVKKAKCMLELQRFKGINPAVIEAIRKLAVQLVPEFQDPLEPLAIEEKTVWRLEELRITSEYQLLRMVTLLVLPQQNWGSLMLMHVEGEDHRISNNVDALAKMVWYFSGDGRSHRSSSQSGLSASSTSPNYGLSSSCGGNYNSGSSSESVTSGDSRQGDMPLTPNSPASTKELSELIKSRDNQRVWNLLRGIAEKDLDMNDEQLKSLLMVACSGEDSLAKMRVPLLIGLLYCAARYEREVEGAIRQELAQLCKQEDECLDLFSFRLANSVLRG